jgi:molybdenum cofactor cytidylyltransferase
LVLSSKLSEMPVPVIILAAGASRRLGQPKQLARVAGETLLGRTVRVVRESGAQPVFVVVGAYCERILAAVDLTGTHSILNPEWEQGIASSIRAGVTGLLRELPGAAAVLLLVCDQPRLTAEHLRALVATMEGRMEPVIVASCYAGVTGIPAIFPRSEFAQLLGLRGDAGARSLLRNPRCAMMTVAFEGGEMDVDTEADLAEALRVSN